MSPPTCGYASSAGKSVAADCQCSILTVHETRRTCASLLVALDVHPRVAMQILRHSQIAMTMEIYSEVPTAKSSTAL